MLAKVFEHRIVGSREKGCEIVVIVKYTSLKFKYITVCRDKL